MSYLAGSRLMTNAWLTSRQATRVFYIATLLVIALIPVFLGRVNPAGLPFWERLPIGLLGIFGPLAFFTLWIGMWVFWARVDQSTKAARRFWFMVLLIGLCYGSCLYFYFVYRPQVTRLQQQR